MLKSFFVATLRFVLLIGPLCASAAEPVRIVALGDSLTSGYMIAPQTAFPARLQSALLAKGLAVEITNAGMPGDTASGGLARLDWSVPPNTDAVILELGGNDGWFAADPATTKAALDQIIRRLKARNIEVLFCGIKAPRHHSPDYVRTFDNIFPQLAAKHGVLFYPFFLDGVVYHPTRAQHDGIHPTEAGINYIVARILPKAEQLVEQVKRRRGINSARDSEARPPLQENIVSPIFQ